MAPGSAGSVRGAQRRSCWTPAILGPRQLWAPRWLKQTTDPRSRAVGFAQRPGGGSTRVAPVRQGRWPSAGARPWLPCGRGVGRVRVHGRGSRAAGAMAECGSRGARPVRQQPGSSYARPVGTRGGRRACAGWFGRPPAVPLLPDEPGASVTPPCATTGRIRPVAIARSRTVFVRDDCAVRSRTRLVPDDRGDPAAGILRRDRGLAEDQRSGHPPPRSRPTAGPGRDPLPAGTRRPKGASSPPEPRSAIPRRPVTRPG